MQLQNHNSAQVNISGGSSSAKGFGRGSGKEGRKGPPIVWEDVLLVQSSLVKLCMNSQLSASLISPKTAH